MRSLHIVVLLVVVSLVAAACGDDSTDDEPTTITLMTHDSFAVSDEVLAEFEAQTDITVEILQAGDAGAMVNQAILTKDNPLADVLFGVDNTLLSRALDEQLFVPYTATGIDAIDAEFVVAGNPVTPIDFGDVCINTDPDALAVASVVPPARLADLTDPVYSGTLVVEDPSTSSPGLAFLLATIATFGEGGDSDWRDYWAGLVANDVAITSGWEQAYYGEFSGGSGEGSRPLVVSYATSPAAEVVFGELAAAPTGVTLNGCFRQIEYAGVLAGTEHEKAAQQFIDFMLTVPFQEDIPLNMFVFPVNDEAALPAVFTEHALAADAPVVMDPPVIDANRERWIAEWAAIVR
jgi:thiamine transport system substrate-binding protein